MRMTSPFSRRSTARNTVAVDLTWMQDSSTIMPNSQASQFSPPHLAKNSMILTIVDPVSRHRGRDYRGDTMPFRSRYDSHYVIVTLARRLKGAYVYLRVVSCMIRAPLIKCQPRPVASFPFDPIYIHNYWGFRQPGLKKFVYRSRHSVSFSISVSTSAETNFF